MFTEQWGYRSNADTGSIYMLTGLRPFFKQVYEKDLVKTGNNLFCLNSWLKQFFIYQILHKYINLRFYVFQDVTVSLELISAISRKTLNSYSIFSVYYILTQNSKTEIKIIDTSPICSVLGFLLR